MGQAVQKLVIASVPAEACQVERAIMAAVASHGFDEHAAFAIRLALDEALANAIHHGNRNDPAKHITVEYEVTDDRACIRVCDEGPGFKPEGVPDPTIDENIERPNGRGVLLMRAYMTEVRFNETGNCVTLIKTRNCPLSRNARR